jgi:cell division septation protein DedD
VRTAGALFGSALAILVSATITRADTMLPVTSIGTQGANDSADWSQLGADATSLGSSFTATSAGGLGITGTLTGSGSLISVACPASPCSWNGTGFNADDSLVWTSAPGKGGNGPLKLNMGTAVAGIGAFIEADGSAQFTAQIQVFNGSTSLGSFPVTSDGNGDAIYLGAIDKTGNNITSAVFSITNCGGSCADFAIDKVNLNDRTIASPTPTATPSPSPTGSSTPATATPTPTPTGTTTATPTATPTPGGKLRVMEKSVSLFATVKHHASATVKVMNHGTGLLAGSVSGPAGSPFSSTGTGPFTFSPGGARRIKVTFSPTVKGKFKAVLTVTSDDPKHPSVSVPITGTAN